MTKRTSSGDVSSRNDGAETQKRRDRLCDSLASQDQTGLYRGGQLNKMRLG
jgi:hypothetical protein